MEDLIETPRNDGSGGHHNSQSLDTDWEGEDIPRFFFIFATNSIITTFRIIITAKMTTTNVAISQGKNNWPILMYMERGE